MPINWLKAICPVCRREFEYPEGGYKPKTCNKFDCLYEFHHHPERYLPLEEQLDKCRKEAKI